jgi:polysaccharide biosynthesis/export protein
MKHFGVFVAIWAAAALCGCAPLAPQALTPSVEALAPPAPAATPYRLGGGDRIRIIVFGQDNLSNSYSVDGTGTISMPLIGRVRAQGQTTAELEKTVGAKLRQGYIREPSVSIEVESFRPFFVLGEVNAAGQYPFVNGMTVQNAVAIAGGFTPRAALGSVDITRNIDGRLVTFQEPLSSPMRPGDTITVEERFF